MAGVLVLDLAPHVDPLGFLDCRAAAGAALDVPTGVRVELHIGPARTLIDVGLGELLRCLRPAREVVVVGTSATGVGALVRVLRVAFARGATAATAMQWETAR